MATRVGAKRRAAPENIFAHSKRSKIDHHGPDRDGQESESGTDDAHSDPPSLSDDDDDDDDDDDPRSASCPSTQPSTPGSAAPASRPRDKKFVCHFPECGKAYNRPVRLAEHQRSHTNERPFVCPHDDCDKSFLRESHLKHHVKARHDDVRDYPCDACDKAFHTASRLKEHKKMHDRAKQEFRCHGFDPCRQLFRKQDTLDRHIQLVHLNEKPFVCDHTIPSTALPCGARFKTSTHLIAHKDREHSGNRFWCKICSPEMAELDPRLNPTVFDTAVGFPTYVEMQQHVKTLHPPTCDLCRHVCASNRDLKAHMEIQHAALNDRRNFVCDHPDCGRGFTKKGNLDVHKRTVHAKQKQFVCGESHIKPCRRVPEWDGRSACGRAFGTKASLEEHVRTQHLHLPRSARRLKTLKEEPIASSHLSMEDVQPAAPSNTLSLLTGFGYESRRTIACLEPHCEHRMQRYYDLERHLQAAHAYSVTEAIEAVKEQEALSGGDFWYGGDQHVDNHPSAADPADIELVKRLQALDPTDASHEYWPMDD